MTLAIEEVLAVWRDAERARDALPATHPRRTAIDADITELRAIYARLTDLIARSDHDLRVSNDQIASAMATLERVRARLEAVPMRQDDRTADRPTSEAVAGLAVEPLEG